MKLNFHTLLLPIGAMIIPITIDATFPLIPLFQSKFGVDLATAHSAISYLVVPFALFMLVSGPIAAFIGRRRCLIGGFLGIALGGVVISSAENFSAILVGRMIQGLSSAFVLPCLIASIGDQVSKDSRGKVMGIFMVSITLGTAVGPAMGGWLAEFGGISLASSYVGGFALFFAALYAFIMGESPRKPVSASSFSQELKLAYSNIRVLGIGVVGATVFIAMIGIMTFSVSFLSWPPLEKSPGQIGNVLSFGLAAGMIGAILGGYIADRFGREYGVYIGFLVMIVGGGVVIYTCQSLETVGLTGFLIGLPLLAGGHAIAMTALETLSVEIIPTHRDATTSVFNALRFSGYGMAPVIGAYLYTKVGAVGTYGLLTAVLIIGLVFFYALAKKALSGLLGSSRLAESALPLAAKGES